MGGAARLRFTALRAGVELFDHAVKYAIERRYVGGRLFSEFVSVMIHRDPAVGANHWVSISHFQHLNEAERSLGRIAATPDSTLLRWANPQSVLDCCILCPNIPRLLRHMRPSQRTQSQIC